MSGGEAGAKTVDANIWVAALDRHDRFHANSVALLHALAANGASLHAPAFVLLEVACAVTRRAGNANAGHLAAQRLRTHPTLTLHPVDDQLLTLAMAIASEHSLRAADALYAATAQLFDAPLVTWDAELIARAGATSPEHWL